VLRLLIFVHVEETDEGVTEAEPERRFHWVVRVQLVAPLTGMEVCCRDLEGDRFDCFSKSPMESAHQK
jgi:hypothetical protein